MVESDSSERVRWFGRLLACDRPLPLSSDVPYALCWAILPKPEVAPVALDEAVDCSEPIFVTAVVVVVVKVVVDEMGTATIRYSERMQQLKLDRVLASGTDFNKIKYKHCFNISIGP